MAEDKGDQIVSLIHFMAATSPNVNRRHQDIRQLGIYQGGRLTVTDGETKAASLSTLVAEISDGTYQVKVQTTTVVSFTAAEATPYCVLRWLYTGAASDFVEILAVTTPATDDIVIAKATFTGGGDLQGFDYGDSIYPRTTPNTQDLFLKIEPTEDTELKVRIRAGQIQTVAETKVIPDQKSTLFTAPTANSKIYLVYVDTNGTIAIDSTGTEAASPATPEYSDKMVLAEVTLVSTSTNITASMIKDVRDFIQIGATVDEVTITKNSSGKLRTKCIENLTSDPTTPITGQMWIRTDI